MPYSSPAPWQGQGSGPTGEQGWLFFPTALPPDLAVTRAQLRHPLLCGGFLLVLKGKRTQEGAATPCLEPFWGAAPRMQPHPTWIFLTISYLFRHLSSFLPIFT